MSLIDIFRRKNEIINPASPTPDPRTIPCLFMPASFPGPAEINLITNKCRNAKCEIFKMLIKSNGKDKCCSKLDIGEWINSSHIFIIKTLWRWDFARNQWDVMRLAYSPQGTLSPFMLEQRGVTSFPAKNKLNKWIKSTTAEFPDIIIIYE